MQEFRVEEEVYSSRDMKKEWKKSQSVKKSKKNEDIISNLPEAILQKILSFLDMKYVVQTCVLAKSWRSLWKSLPLLMFNYAPRRDPSKRASVYLFTRCYFSVTRSLTYKLSIILVVIFYNIQAILRIISLILTHRLKLQYSVMLKNFSSLDLYLLSFNYLCAFSVVNR